MLKNFKHLSSNPAILNGKPCIKGSRISVSLVLEWLASGANIQEIHQQYPHLSMEGLEEAVRYAAQLGNNEILINAEVVIK